jgi:hypothetical protein
LVPFFRVAHVVLRSLSQSKGWQSKAKQSKAKHANRSPTNAVAGKRTQDRGSNARPGERSAFAQHHDPALARDVAFH